MLGCLSGLNHSIEVVLKVGMFLIFKLCGDCELKAISFKNEVEKSFLQKFAEICSLTKCKQNSAKDASILTHYAIS